MIFFFLWILLWNFGRQTKRSFREWIEDHCNSPSQESSHRSKQIPTKHETQQKRPHSVYQNRFTLTLSLLWESPNPPPIFPPFLASQTPEGHTAIPSRIAFGAPKAAMVTSRDVQEIVSKLSSDKAKAREVYSRFLLSIFFPRSPFGCRENAGKERKSIMVS